MVENGGPPSGEATAEKVAVFGPDACAERERQGDTRPVVGVLGNPGAGSGFKRGVERMRDDVYVAPGEQHRFGKQVFRHLIGQVSTLGYDAQASREFVACFIPSGSGDVELHARVAE